MCFLVLLTLKYRGLAKYFSSPTFLLHVNTLADQGSNLTCPIREHLKLPFMLLLAGQSFYLSNISRTQLLKDDLCHPHSCAWGHWLTKASLLATRSSQMCNQCAQPGAEPLPSAAIGQTSHTVLQDWLAFGHLAWSFRAAKAAVCSMAAALPVRLWAQCSETPLRQPLPKGSSPFALQPLLHHRTAGVGWDL